ncbi:MAG TPA: hypothetical protein VG937_31860 [Polyangiaceae bacterium]|jgi:hypothetical protein|nr:hypothetical protein [Polyangiaceae bacterium]
MVRYGLVLAGLLLSLPARAAEPKAAPAASPSEPAPSLESPVSSPFRVLLRGCSALREPEIERMLAAELAADSLPVAAVREPSWLVVRCAGTSVVLEVHDARSDKTVQRRFDFAAARPMALARLIAIAAAELVSASSAELARASEPPAGKAATLAPVDKPRKAGSYPPHHRAYGPALLLGTDPALAREGVGPSGERVIYGDYVWERLPGRIADRLVALVSLRRFVDRGGVFAGGGVRFGSDLSPLHAWSIDAIVEAGTLHRRRAGPLYLESWSLGGSLGWVFDFGGRFTARTGGGLRAGFVRTREVGGSIQLGMPAFWGWPFVTGSGTAQFGRLVVDLSVEGGYAAIPIGVGAVDTSLRGVWSSVQFGAGVRL